MSNSKIIKAVAAACAIACLSGLGGVSPAVGAPHTSTSASVMSRPGSVSQEQARRKAMEYLSIMSFSRTGLIKQLMFEGFNRADATYGVNATHTNWYKQAALKAAEYMKLMAFSRRSLISQLKYEGFTTGQAAYGARSVGL